MKSLWDHENNVKTRLATKKRILLLLDFDGTLAPIVSTPEKARLPKPTLARLTKLKKSARFRIAVISGRSLEDLKKKVRINGIFYAGNHGLEIRGPGLLFQEPKAFALKSVVQHVFKDLKKKFPRIPGFLLENKGLTLSLHYRKISKRHLLTFNHNLHLWQTETRHLPLRWLKGHKVWELRSNVGWDKGKAALFLSRRLRCFPVAIGDDRTDEDMFRAIGKNGISIRVGRFRSSHAHYFLKNQTDVQRFLGWIQLLISRFHQFDPTVLPTSAEVGTLNG